MYGLYLFFIIALILLLVCAVLITVAAAQLDKNPLRGEDPKLNQAYNLLIAGSVISWIAVFIGIVIFGLVVYSKIHNVKVIGLSEAEHARNKKSAILGLMITCFALAAIDGVLAAIAAAQMISSESFSTKSSSDKEAYNLSVASAIVGFGVVVVIMIILIVYFTSKKGCSKSLDAEMIKTS